MTKTRINILLSLFLTILALGHQNTYAAIFIVDNTSDADNLAAYTNGDLTNSLRKCIRLANASAGADIINFNIGTAAPHIIVAATQLPNITDIITINGLTQPGASAGNPTIEINGGGQNVLQLDAGSDGSTIQGLVLFGANRGIYINNSSNNTIIANHIGTNQNATALPTDVILWNCIEIQNSTNTVIGGTNGVNTRNILSGANEMGIRNQGTSTGTIIIGNYIGTDATGTIAIPNRQNGIFLLGGSHNAQIGGPTAAHRNIISGNLQQGINIENSTDGLVQQNYVGTTVSGLVALGNEQRGVNIITNCTGYQILDNVISSNTQIGLFIANNSHRPIVKGNKIGISADGNTMLGNLQNGIEIQNSFKPILGGASASERNIISNNGNFGVRIDNGDSAIIKGNYIGVDGTGLLDHGNIQVGIMLSQSDNILFGGAIAGERNIISGNNQRAVAIENNCNRALIRGNYIGVGIDGTTPINNGQMGLQIINSFKPIIGGDLIAERNIISNNGQMGLRIDNGDSAIVRGNYIGVDATGLVDFGNNEVGVYINASDDVVFGGTLANHRNVISGNTQRGVVFDNSPRPSIKGNVIGLSADLSTSIGNGQHGLHIINSTTPIVGGASTTERNYVASNGQMGIMIENSPTPIVKGNVIGLAGNLTTAFGNTEDGLRINNSASPIVGGVTLLERNYISSNGRNGITINTSAFAIVKGNYVGVDGTGLLNRGNNIDGIYVENSRQSIIGGSSRLEGNISCGSIAGSGIIITGDSKRCIIRGNFCGIGADGLTDIGNGINGINLFWTSDTCIVGGSNFMDRNVSSNNGKVGNGDGIRAEGPDGHIIKGNYCGVDSSGTIPKGNAWAGISLNESNDNPVGGSGPFEGNICSGNLNEGVWFRNANRNQFYGNFVGTDKTGTLQLGNQDWGLALSDQGSNNDNIIGGSPANANIIAYNQHIDPVRNGQGVYIHTDCQRNLITYNKIFCNAGLGIDLNGAGNESIAAPVIITSLANSTNGTGTPGRTVHVYRNATLDAGSACDCEGELFIGETTVQLDGSWTLVHNLGLTPTNTGGVTATQTNSTNSTSEFSNCLPTCEFEMSAEASDTILNTFEPSIIDITSLVKPNPFNVFPVHYFWSSNQPDTLGANLFSRDTSIQVDLSSSTFTLSEKGTYKIYLVVAQGLCVDSILVELNAYQIPNLVTPNDDGLNDTWKVTTSTSLFDVEIYNRWGDRVYAESGYTNGWNTKEVSDGLYYFYLKSKTAAVKDFTGWVQVMR